MKDKKTPTNPRGGGRKSREELGLPPAVNTTVRVEKKVIDMCRYRHGSIAMALRYAALNGGIDMYR